ncbi:hypothetical protein PIB30_005596 [Stylosanthes scabra]|uniref:Uncharacterized protein n=1 Tax=Stylosanthes scabra TaxID=79078 RepID=A0ABU6R650_9FABA|nr:hypothetical protein [Stylosanthes scabra]
MGATICRMWRSVLPPAADRFVSNDHHGRHLKQPWVEKSMRKAKKNIGSKNDLEKACKSGDFTKKEECEVEKRSHSHPVLSDSMTNSHSKISAQKFS